MHWGWLKAFHHGPSEFAFLGVAAGSILFVVIELLGVGRKLGYRELAMWGILLGLFLGFATDMVLVAAGT